MRHPVAVGETGGKGPMKILLLLLEFHTRGLKKGKLSWNSKKKKNLSFWRKTFSSIFFQNEPDNNNNNNNEDNKNDEDNNDEDNINNDNNDDNSNNNDKTTATL